METTYGILSLVPVSLVIIVAIVTRRSFEPLLLGGIVGYILLEPTNFLIAWINSLTTIAGELGWYYVLFAVCGILILLLDKSGGALGFADLSSKFARTRSSSLIMTWLLGIAIFLDDYLNCLGVSVAMKSITDKFKVPREFLAYVVNSTGATVCLLVPVSTWAVYMASQFELVGVTKNGTGLGAYIASIPYMLYAWIAVIIVPLFILKIIPAYGPMKKAIERAETEGHVLPLDGSNLPAENTVDENIPKSGAANFIIPIVVLTVVALVKNDVMLGIFASLIACAIIYLPRKVMKPIDFLESVPSGIQSMATVMLTMTGSFVLNAVNQEMGLTEYVLDTVTPLISGPVFPMITFIVLSGLSFATASPWAMATVSFPIIMPLAQAVGADPFIIGGALISGTAFGSHACFYGDAAILTSAACNIKPFEYGRTSIPLIALPAALAIIAYLILGIIVA